MHYRLFIAVLLLAGGPLAHTQELSIASEIENVTVFLDGAQVTRQARADLPAGRSTLVFTGLTDQADPNSLRLSASEAITILSVAFRKDFLKPPKADEEVARLEGEIERLETEIKREEAALRVHAEEEALLEANRRVGGNTQNLTVDQLRSITAFYRERLTEINLDKLAIAARIDTLRKEQEAFQKQLSEWRTRNQAKATGQMVVAVEANRRSGVDFEITYQVGSAGWEPVYDLRVSDIASPVQLDYRARVHQQTGEDWPDVRLTLSTGNPSLNQRAPQWQPWWLYPPQPAKMLEDFQYDADPEVYEAQPAPGRSYAPGPAVTQESRATTVAFVVSEPYDVPADGKKYGVKIAEYELPATYEYYAFPKPDPTAYLRAHVTDWEQYNLLDGQASLFLEGAYLGQSYLSLQNTADSLSLELGRDPGIVIRRTKEKQYTDKQFIGGKQTRTVGWRIELRNAKKQPVNILIEDQYPVSTTEEIEVVLDNASGARVVEGLGKLSWLETLAPGASRTLTFRYSVKYPKKMNLRLE